MLKILIEAFKRSKGRGPNPIEMLQLRFKAAQQSGKGEVIQFPPEAITDWTKPRPQPQIKKRIKNYKSSTQKIEEKYGIKLKGDETFGEIEEIIKNLPEKKASGGRAGFFVGGMGGIRSLGKKYRGSTLQSLLENPKLVGAELGHDGIMELMNLLPGLFAEGGRAGFFGGGMGRRGFLKLMAALGATGVAAKSGLVTLFKGGAKKQIAKELTSVPIGNASGMPTWFKPLVNKVIKEGDDVTKKAATGEREIVHTKKLDEYDEVTVTQDLDTGNVRVDYHGTNNMGDGPIQLDYRASQEIPLKGKKGSTKTKEEFSAVESEPEIVNWDGDMEWSGENVVSKVDDLLTDTTKLETYATGKNPNIKKLLKSEKKKKHVNKLNEDQMEQLEYIENKSGHLAPERLLDEPIPDDFASGGRVPLAGGKEVLKGLAWLANKIAPKSTKIGQTSKTMAPKTQLKRAIAGFQEREAAKKLKVWNDPDKVRAAVDDIFSSGDYKMDAEMAAEALVENNPKAFGGKLIDDLDDATRSEIYGAVLRVVQSDLAKTLQLKRLSKPTKTLEGIKKTGTINISDPNVADEFTRFMKEVDPKGHKKLEQTVDLMNLDPKGKKGHASGGRVSLSAGGLAGMLGE